MCSVISCTWISKVRDLRLRNLTAAGPPRSDDIRAHPPASSGIPAGNRPFRSAERVDDPAAAEELLAPVHDGALTGRDAALRRPELDPSRVPERLDHGRDVVAPVADPNLRLEGHRGRGLAGHPRHPIGDRPRARE